MFYRILDNKLLDYADYEYDNNCKQTKIITQKELAEHPNKVIIEGDVLVLNPDYEKEEAEKEHQRVLQLNMTKLDFVKALAPYGVTYEAIKVLLSTSSEAQMNWDLCERVYRFNPFLDPMASQFGITPEQLDEIFKAKGV